MPTFGKDLAIAIAIVLVLLPTSALADRAKARALTSEGQTQEELGYHQAALALYERAIRSDPDYHASYELAIPLWMRFGKLTTAQTRLETLTLRCKNCSFAWYALGALYRKGGRFDLAVLAYEVYLAKRPEDPDAHFGLAMALGAQGDAKAPLVLRRYLELERRPERAAFRQQARRLLLRLTRQEAGPKGAQEDLVALADVGDPKAASLHQVAELIENGQLVSAESLLNQRYETSAASLALRTKIAESRGQWFHQACFTAILWLWP